jgi:glycosyltransferase involved in cell wall biosynthesis
MKTLVVAPYSPYPVVFGGAIRLYHFLKMFAEISEVSVVAWDTWGDDGSAKAHLETFCKRAVLVPGSPLKTQPKWLLQARGLAGTKTFQYYSFYTRQFQAEIDRLLRADRYDNIIIDQSQMSYYGANQPGALKILDQHNIEYELLERRVPVQTNPLKKAALAVEARRYRKYELEVSEQFDLVFTTSERERDKLRKVLRRPLIESLPNSIDTDFLALRAQAPAANEITFVGTTHVDANRDGIIYFMEQIFPLIERRVPDVRFTIVGGKPPAEIREFGRRPNVEVTGFVDDMRPYMARAKALVVPLRSGGGTRLKILEGLSMGVPTVSTTLGAEGIDVVDGTHLLIADTPQLFADRVVALLQDAALGERLRLPGRQLAVERYSWRAVGRSLGRYLADARARAEGVRAGRAVGAGSAAEI